MEEEYNFEGDNLDDDLIVDELIDGEAEGIASELCRKGIVDYVMTEDMDSLVYETPKLIRKCVFKNVKNYEYSLFDLNEILEKLNMNINEFKDMCILMGCDYVQPITRIGNITAYKLIKTHGSIENIIKWNDINKKYDIPCDYLETYKNALYLFNIFKEKLDESIINKPKIDIINFKKYLQNVFNFNETDHKNGFNGFDPENFFKTEAGVFKNELELEATDVPNPLPDGNIGDTLTEGFTNGEEKTAEVNLIWAKWCGFCKKAMPDWERLEQTHNGSNINGYKLILNKYEESDNSDLIGSGKKFEVDGFPTIIIIKNDSSEQIKLNSIEYEDMIQKITNNL